MRKISALYLYLIILTFFIFVGNVIMPVTGEALATERPWLSSRHDLNNSAAAVGNDYPTTPEIFWEKKREAEAPDDGTGTGARSTTPLAVGGGLVIVTGHGGRVEARDQDTGALVWTKMYNWIQSLKIRLIHLKTGARDQVQPF